MNCVGSGFIPILIYSDFAFDGAIEILSIMTESSDDILTEDGSNLLIG